MFADETQGGTLLRFSVCAFGLIGLANEIHTALIRRRLVVRATIS